MLSSEMVSRNLVGYFFGHWNLIPISPGESQESLRVLTQTIL